MINAIPARGEQVRTPRMLRWTAFGAVFGALLMPLGATSASGQNIIEIQEDWELVIAQPDSNSSAPQVTCVISPHGHVNGVHTALEINQQTHPQYAPGGVQMQTWDGEYVLDSERFPNDGVLSTQAETITWTQRMALAGGHLVFDVDDATSSTWGNFGANGHLWISRNTSLSNLNNYSPEVSVQHSGVGYAANRVQRLVLKEIRYYTSNGLFSKDTTQRVVHELTP